MMRICFREGKEDESEDEEKIHQKMKRRFIRG
jgi:hypothetical protein